VPPAGERGTLPAVRALEVVVVDEGPAPRGLYEEAGRAVAGPRHHQPRAVLLVESRRCNAATSLRVGPRRWHRVMGRAFRLPSTTARNHAITDAVEKQAKSTNPIALALRCCAHGLRHNTIPSGDLVVVSGDQAHLSLSVSNNGNAKVGRSHSYDSKRTSSPIVVRRPYPREHLLSLHDRNDIPVRGVAGCNRNEPHRS
jgi:hypothetical protein